LKIEFRSFARGVSGVASFITNDEQLKDKTEAAVVLHEGFPCHQFIKLLMKNVMKT